MLFIYYKKTYNFIKRINVKNKFILMFAIIFILLKLIMFDIILKNFIRNINDYEIRKKVIYDMIVINRFLYFVSNFIEKIKHINVKI